MVTPVERNSPASCRVSAKIRYLSALDVRDVYRLSRGYVDAYAAARRYIHFSHGVTSDVFSIVTEFRQKSKRIGALCFVGRFSARDQR